LSSNPIEVVSPSFNLEEQREKISQIVTTFLPELTRLLAQAELEPLIVCVGLVSVSGVYATSISRRDVCEDGLAGQISREVADLIRDKIVAQENVTCYPEPNTPGS
jgi:hypothetical protein